LFGPLGVGVMPAPNIMLNVGCETVAQPTNGGQQCQVVTVPYVTNARAHKSLPVLENYSARAIWLDR
jgi:hypothetical protein